MHAATSGHTVVTTFERTTTYAGDQPEPPAKFETEEQRFGKAVRAGREVRGWTQEQLRDALIPLGLPMTKTMMSRLEKGQRPIRINEAAAILTALGMDRTSWTSGGAR